MKIKSIILPASLLLALPIFLWSGIYNIAANDKHWAITNAIIEILRERSIKMRADDIITPMMKSGHLLCLLNNWISYPQNNMRNW